MSRPLIQVLREMAREVRPDLSEEDLEKLVHETYRRLLSEVMFDSPDQPSDKP